MNIWRQIFFGSVVLIACIVIDVVVLGFGIETVRILAVPNDSILHGTMRILVAAAFVLTGQTIQVIIWAATLRGLNALGHTADAVYFSLVTMTTLGYGDITLDPRFRAFGAMAAVTGLMTYGLSTAFMVGVVSGVMQH